MPVHRLAAAAPSGTLLAAARANFATMRTSVTAVWQSGAPDERQALALLLAPFLIVAASLATQNLGRNPPALVPAAATGPPAAVVASPWSPAPAMTPVKPLVDEIGSGLAGGAPSSAERTTVAMRRAPPAAVSARPDVAAAPLPQAPAGPAEARLAAAAPLPSPAPPLPAGSRPSAPVGEVPLPPFELPELALLPPAPMRPQPAALTPRHPALAPRDGMSQPSGEFSGLAPPRTAVPPAATRMTPSPQDVCIAPAGLTEKPGQRIGARPAHLDPQAFGLALAAAAKAQTGELVVYNARYMRISYPGGDVPALYGVCTDVVVRAYRTLGIDLQELIRTTRSGRGDPSIDHRRVEVVRRFLEKHGASLPITDHPEDYLPGDIVTYYRPQNRSSTSHIAIVTDVVAPSGRYMIAHNRGWGTQLEDALFVDKITGHYRFTGLSEKTPVATAGAPSARSAGRARSEAAKPRRTAEARFAASR